MINEDRFIELGLFLVK